MLPWCITHSPSSLVDWDYQTTETDVCNIFLWPKIVQENFSNLHWMLVFRELFSPNLLQLQTLLQEIFFRQNHFCFFSSSRVGWSGIRFSNWRLKFRRCVWISNSDGKFPVQQTFGVNLNESLYVRGLTIALIYRLKLKHSVRTSVLSRLLQYQVVRLFVVSLESYVGSNWQCEAKVWSIMYNTAVCAGIYGLSVSMGNQFSTDYSTTIRPI